MSVSQLLIEVRDFVYGSSCREVLGGGFFFFWSCGIEDVAD